jgi:hypothetical protein
MLSHYYYLFYITTKHLRKLLSNFIYLCILGFIIDRNMDFNIKIKLFKLMYVSMKERLFIEI